MYRTDHYFLNDCHYQLINMIDLHISDKVPFGYGNCVRVRVCVRACSLDVP